ncbi:MAG TPA: TadE/TadG family type IV pilus assembly protein [Candidatus Nitrosotalea sp.]|nr:TadE/TadG family type IV pilus assembly protein [Candidatus Nitrosotalea sp.]
MLQRGAAMVEFALAWPVLLLLTSVSVQLSLWGAVAEAAVYAAGAGARAGSVAGANAAVAEAVAVLSLSPALAGESAVAGCPAASRRAARPELTVCASYTSSSVTVAVRGSAPLLLPLPGPGMPVWATVTLPLQE